MLSQPQVVNNTVDLEQILSHFLNRRRTVQSKFLNSDLEKVVIQLKNITARELFE
jgi:DNA gyrase/topoisomerase IV subunit A